MTTSLVEFDTATAVAEQGIHPLHPTLPHAIVYTTASCGICPSYIRRLRKNSAVALAVVELNEGERAHEHITGNLGMYRVPVTIAHYGSGDELMEVFAGPDPMHVRRIESVTADALARLSRDQIDRYRLLAGRQTDLAELTRELSAIG